MWLPNREIIIIRKEENEMSFADDLGSFLGTLMKKTSERAVLLNQYKEEYEDFSNDELQLELSKLQRYNNDVYRNRRMVVKSILHDRGVM